MSGFFKTQRFMPLFVTQFFSAFNDNLFKNALVILVTYKLAESKGASELVNIAFGVFTLPTLLFAYLSGQISDKFDRNKVARWVKIAEIGLAAFGATALYLGNLPLLMVALFGFGTHSAFFGPVKYAILPQHLKEDELIAGNGYIDAGTFLAILGGTMVSGLLILTVHGTALVTVIMVGVAVLGYLAARRIPHAPAPVPDMKLAFNPFTETFNMIRYSSQRREEFLCILGISWFWFIGALFLAQFSPFTKEILHADEHVVTLFLIAFSVGIAIGSLLCTKLIKGAVRATPVPLGALGMTLFALDLYFTSRGVPVVEGALLDIGTFLQHGFGIHIFIDLVGLAICGGIFIVPLYALLQVSADKNHGARAIASNNLMNSVFMVASALMAVLLIHLGFTTPDIFLTGAILNAVVAIYICKLLPFSIFGAILKVMFRVEVKGLENWAKAGDRVLIVANHTAYLDAAIFASFLPERVSFAVNTFTAREWWLRPLLKLVDAMPLDPTNPMATKMLIDRLKKNTKVMIFPEGRLTMTGALMKVYEGPGMIADKADAMILPVRIDGAQYSPLSKLKGKVRIRLFPKVTLTILPPRKFSLPEEAKGRRRRELAGAQLYNLMSELIYDSSPVESTLMQRLVEAQHVHGPKHVIAEDPRRQPATYRAFTSAAFVLAHRLKREIGADEKHIGILLPNMVGTAQVFFAVQALGRVVAMLNFSSGSGQILSAAKAADLKTVLTSRQFIETGKLGLVVQALEGAGIRMVYVEDIRAKIGFGDKLLGLLAGRMPRFALALCPKTTPDSPALILFTSGSEGMPKGVVLSHRTILADHYQLASRIAFGPQDIVFNCLPMFHSFGLISGTLLPLLSGIKVFFYPSPLHYRVVPELIYDSDATVLFGTDTFLAGYARFAKPYDFYALRYVFAGAERLKEETRKTWFDKFGLRIFEGYGATETAAVLSVNTPMHFRAGTVGRLLPRIEAKLETVPGIEDGKQLFVSGPNIMLGYMKEDRPGVLQPQNDGWYDTGDIVSIDEEGYITIRGRVKRFAKIGGEMISLTAVETALGKIWPGSMHAVVSIPDAKKGEAIVLLTERANADLSELLAPFRAQGLTELALPKKLIVLAKLPLLGTGKTDYVAARKLVLEQVDSQ